MIGVVVVGYGWQTQDYYVYDRQSDIFVVEVQPVTVSKSTLALYTVDGAATAFKMNIFLVPFTTYCGTLYRTPLTTCTQSWPRGLEAGSQGLQLTRRCRRSRPRTRARGRNRLFVSADDAKYSSIYVNYVQLYNIDMSQFTPSNWTAYSDVNAFFVRTLTPGVRPIAFPNDNRHIVSPADARVYAFQPVPTVRSARSSLCGPFSWDMI